MLHFVIVACMTDNREFVKGDTPTKPVKGRKTQEETLTTFVGCVVSI